jgi:putative phage-type endonuclease
MITASDAAAAVGENPYSSRQEFIDRKCSNTCGAFTGNSATLWGEHWEDVALQKYCDTHQKIVYQLNLVQHKTIAWLGGSPDGVTSDGILVEIKCPPNRKIKPGLHGVPSYYIHQVQMLMHVCDLETCHFVQYKPYMGEFAPEVFEVTTIARDPNWWSTNMPKLSETWEVITKRRELVNGTGYHADDSLHANGDTTYVADHAIKRKRVSPPAMNMECIISDN